MTLFAEAPTLSSAHLVDLDRAHLIHPHQTALRTDRRMIVRARGALVWDADGRELLDVTGAGNWVGQVGHGRAELAEAAVRQISELSYFSTFYEFSHDKAVRLAARLAGLAPAHINRVFFTNGGSEGNDTAIKTARMYHARRGEASRTWILGRRFGYHGATLGAGTVTGFPPMHQAGPNLPHVEHLTPPFCYHAEFYGGRDTTDFLIDELTATIERIGAENIAAMLAEPILGSGGVVEPPKDYWPRVRAVLRANGILLVADEVITAYGRTGAWFDSAERGMEPDIIVTAKGLTSGYIPMGAVLMSDDVAATVADGDDFYFHGHTYSGHPVGAAVALRNLDMIEDEGLLAQSLRIGDWFRAGLAGATDLPAVGDVRVVGATVGMELVSDKETRAPMDFAAVPRVVDELYRTHGVIFRSYGNTIVMGPPLVLDESQAAKATAAAMEVFSRLSPDGTVA